MEQKRKLLKLAMFRDDENLFRTPAKPISNIDENLREFAHNLLYTMYESNAIGLAASHVGVLKHMIVVDVGKMPIRAKEKGLNPDDPNSLKPEPFIMINPSIIWYSEEKDSYMEGSVSLPGEKMKIIRPKEIEVEYLDLEGEKHKLHANGILSTVIQHETDQANGIFFTDHV